MPHTKIGKFESNMEQKKIILVTGATGLIGKEVLNPLLKRGFEIHALTIDTPTQTGGAVWHRINLFNFDAVNATVTAIRPTHLLNLAWATTGDYLSNPINYSFLAAGTNLIRAFAAIGGKRAVFAGTCFEYVFKNEPLKESDPLAPEKYTYTFCKNALREIAERCCSEYGISFGYGRIFFVYGRNEDPRRLAGSIFEKITHGQTITITGGPLARDYMYAKDIANAFAVLVDSDVRGTVNIGTGQAVTIEQFAKTFAEALGHPELVNYQPKPGSQPPLIVADVSRLKNEVGFTPSFTLESALRDIILKQ